MRAAVLWQPTDAFDVREAELTDPGPGQVGVTLHASGVCASDLALAPVFGVPTPFVAGHEGAGLVDAVGEGVEGLAAGDRVVVLWVPPCGSCRPCLRGQEYLCARRTTSADVRAGTAEVPKAKLSIDGTPVQQAMGTATWAERTVVAANAVTRVDDDVPFEVAAMLGCAVPTGVGAAIRSAQVKPGDSVAVIGCGAVGLNALLGAIVAGAAELTAVDPMESRRSFAESLGATGSLAPEAMPELKDVDVVIDAVGRPATVQAAWKAVRRGGTVTVVGAGRPGETVEIPAYELFHDDKKLTGSFHGGISMRRDLPWLVSLWRSGRLPVQRLIDGTADLADINDVVRDQQSGKVVRTIIRHR